MVTPKEERMENRFEVKMADNFQIMTDNKLQIHKVQNK
jgi:hypothetical protein